ncbi:MAG: leucine-rich repeat protein [Ruminococcus sp.]|nr:leucine-rich repeat protein [Ruminococcus sp.]
MKKLRKLTKRALSVFLSMVMLLSVMFSVPFSVNAETAEIQAETQSEVVENNDENISYDSTKENKEQTINIVNEEKTDISDVGSDTPNVFEVDGIRYLDIDNVSVRAIGYVKELLPEDLVIPETVEGKTVTKVASKAFNKANIKSVILPKTVIAIGESAFSDCSLLESATILGNVTTIEDNTFDYCSNLKEVYLPDSITHIGMSAFYHCNIKSIDLPKNLETIDERAFGYCDIRQLTIPSLVSSIGNYAFHVNSNLTDVIFEERTIPLTLRQGAFSTCKKLTSFDFTYCNKLGKEAFSNCESLTSITLPDSVDITSGIEAFSDCINLKTAKLPDNVDIIPEGFFSGCTSLETVEAEKIKKVNSYAFQSCTSLENIQTDQIEFIGINAFEYCRSIVNFDFTNCTRIGNSAFAGCAGFTSINIPGNIVSLGNAVFADCTCLISATLPNTDITMGTGVFSGCSNLKIVKLPDSMEVIPGYVFQDCKNLESIQTGKITSIGSYAFSNCKKITDFDFTYCKSIGSNAFKKCTGFTNMILPDNIAYIGDNAFAECTNLKTAKLPDNIDAIPGGCFRDCTKLESIQTGEIESIGYSAFSNCINLTDISFAKDNSINTVDQKAFMNCYKLTEIDLRKVKYIYDSAFENCASLTKVDLEGNTNLASIGKGAFNYCISLEQIDIPSSCREICDEAFMNCEYLHAVRLRSGLKKIGEKAFFNCFSLYDIYLPKTVEFIGNMAFACFEYENNYYIYTDFTVLGDPDSLADEYAEAYGVKFGLPFPEITSISNTDSGIKISFEKLSGVSGYYRVYRKTAGNSWSKLADVTTASYTDTTAVAGTKYTYTVKFIGYDGTTSLYDKTGLSITRMKTPSVTKIENTTDGAKITWGAVAGATKYRAYVKTSSGWKGLGDTESTSFVHTDAVSGTSYTYTVKAFDSDGASSSHNSTGWTNKFIATPLIKNAEVTNSGIKLTWDKVEGAGQYRVFIKNGTSWKGLATVSGATNSYVDKTATAGNSYTYTIRCMDTNNKPVSGYSKDGFTINYLETPQITGFTNTASGTVIRWNEIEGASKYRLYIKQDGKWTKLTDTADTSFVHTDLTVGIEYTYTIRCVSEDSKTLESGFNSTGYSNLYETKETEFLIGDADLDGKLTVLDATLIQMFLVGTKTLEGDALKAADADLDGGVSILDASLIQMLLVGIK